MIKRGGTCVLEGVGGEREGGEKGEMKMGMQLGYYMYIHIARSLFQVNHQRESKGQLELARSYRQVLLLVIWPLFCSTATGFPLAQW